MRIHPAIYRAFATILPALLGQGLIYLCIVGRIDFVTAFGAILGIGTVALSAAAIFRSETHARLVRLNAPPRMFFPRNGAGN